MAEAQTAVAERECKSRGGEKTYVDCYNCAGEGFSHHDCGDDCCCCLAPEDNVLCEICKGNGGFYVCAHCHPASVED